MTTTTNKGLTLPANNSDVNTWDVPVNANSNILDAALGNVTSLNAVSVSGNVTLTLTQYTPPIIEITGALTGNISYQIPSGVGGFWSVYNNTSGNHTINVASQGGGSSVTLPQGYSTAIISDGTNIGYFNSSPTNPGGSTTQVQYNNGGLLAGSSNLTFSGTTLALTGGFTQTGNTTITGSVSASTGLVLPGSSSGSVKIVAPAVAGAQTYVMPLSTGTNGQLLTTDGTGNLSWSAITTGVASFSAGTIGLSPSTATTGAIVLSGTMATTNGGTGLTSFTSGGALYATSTSALTTGTLPVASGGTGVTSSTGSGSNVLSANATITTPTISGPSISNATMTTPTLGVATATSINGLTISTSTGTLTIANGSILATSGAYSITVTATNTTSVTLPTSGTLVNTGVATLSSLTSIGTIGTGTWQGTTIATGYGGTGLTSFTSGGALYATSSSALTTGTLPVASGGTGAATFTAGLLTASGTSAFSTVAAPSGTIVGTTDTQTLTNKRVSPRIGTVASGSTITPTGDASDQYNVTALAVSATIAAPSGTPTDGQRLLLRIIDNGSPQSLTWTTTSGAYRVQNVVLPTTTVASTALYVGCVWNAANSYWDVLAVS